MLAFRTPVPAQFSSPSLEFGWTMLKFPWSPVKLPYNHLGIDLPAPVGTKGISAYKGIVDGVWKGLLEGNALRIYHPSVSLKGFEVYTYYFHLDKIYVPAGKFVYDEAIYETGNTGLQVIGKGHLHFGLKVGGKWINPRICLPL